MINNSSEKMINQRTDCEDFWLTILSSLPLSSLRYSCFVQNKSHVTSVRVETVTNTEATGKSKTFSPGRASNLLYLLRL